MLRGGGAIAKADELLVVVKANASVLSVSKAMAETKNRDAIPGGIMVMVWLLLLFLLEITLPPG